MNLRQEKIFSSLNFSPERWGDWNKRLSVCHAYSGIYDYFREVSAPTWIFTKINELPSIRRPGDHVETLLRLRLPVAVPSGYGWTSLRSFWQDCSQIRGILFVWQARSVSTTISESQLDRHGKLTLLAWSWTRRVNWVTIPKLCPPPFPVKRI